MAYEIIVAAYDKLGKAKDAAHALESSGFQTSDISLLNRDNMSSTEVRDNSVWRRLFGRNVGENESAAYSRTIESGGALLTLRTQDSDIPRAMKILDVHNQTAELKERTVTTDVTTKAADVTPVSNVKTPVSEEVLRLAEEQIDVGKRVVQVGKARVRRFVVEKPVESRVTLHEEHASLTRRPVTDISTARDVDWADKTFEITETAEQPVVTKNARIAEEVVIRREGSDHVETIRDTVRRQQVEMERVQEGRDFKDVKKAA